MKSAISKYQIGGFFLFLTLLFNGLSFAKNVKIVGDRPLTFYNQSNSDYKTIKLLKVEVSPKKIIQLDQQFKLNQFQSNHILNLQPNSVQLGMGNVPVLDQGMHGTCVTFADSAAIDAVLNQGDYISQLCILQLTNFLNTSAWNESRGQQIFDLIAKYGVINYLKQKKYGCGGLTEYPTYIETTPSSSISVDEYLQHSEKVLN